MYLKFLHFSRNQARIIKETFLLLGFSDTIRYCGAAVLGKRKIKLTIHGESVWVRPGTSDLAVASLSLGEEFSELSKFLEDEFNGVIVDAGAYIGTAALKFRRLFPYATIVCIEPSSDNFEILRQNLHGIDGCTLIKAALAVESGIEIELKNRGTGNWGFTIVAAPEDNPDAVNVEIVSTISLNEIADRFPESSIELLKLDIEGGEKILFEKASSDLGSVRLIFVELHDRIANGCTSAFYRFSRDREIISFGGEKFLSISKD